MVGVLLISHGNIGEAMLAAASHVLGSPQVSVRTIAVAATDDVAMVVERARIDVRAVNDGDGVIVFTDIYGATPSNAGAKLVEPGRVEGVAGVNLPMLVRALAYRSLPLDQVLARSLEAGTRGQVNIKEDACHATAGGN